MNLERLERSTRYRFIALFGLLLTLPTAAAMAAPPCSNDEKIWEPSSTSVVGCRYSLPHWSRISPPCTGVGQLLPTSGGECVVCIDPAYVGTVENGGALPIGDSESSTEPRIFHCLTNPGYQRYVHGACVDEFWDLVVGWWPLDEGAGSTTTEKVSGNDGTIVGAARAPGWIEGGLFFDGVNDYVQIPDSADLDIGTSDFSVDFWIKTEHTSGTQPILDKRVSGPYRGWHVFLYNGRIGMQLADGTFSNFGSTTFIANGAWHHVAITVDRDQVGGMLFYVDGQPAGIQTPIGRQGTLANSTPLRIGARSPGLGGFWRGTIDELAVYLGVLDPTTIAALADPANRGKCY